MRTVPTFAVPFSIPGERAVDVEQDSPADVGGCVYAIVATELGERLELPKFGVSSPVFRQGGVDLPEVIAACHRWEPRAEISTEQELTETLATVKVKVGA